MKFKAIKKRDPQEGLAVVAVVAVMLVLGLVTYSFISIIATHRYAASSQNSSVQAFYLAEAGVEVGKKYYADWWRDESHGTSDAPAWVDTTTGYYLLYDDEPLGSGSFDLWIKWHIYDPQFISYGNVGG